MLAQTEKVITNSSKSAVGLKTAFNILAKWQCSNEQMQHILRVSRAAFYKYREQPASARLSDDQLERISYILNIHATLRVVFSNSENVYGYMKMANGNPYFSGRTPLDIISSGSFASLYEVFKQVDVMRGGQW
ncbi:MAG: hypothetical protein ACI9LM_003389 [Alteromonadaceae bacterium]|jgi:uncharacterized protein (DUF2384 family)